MSHLWQYKPILYILLFLLADKVLLAPAVYERFTLRIAPQFDILHFDNEEYLKDTDRIDVWTLGSSRTVRLAMHVSKEEIDASPLIADSDRRRLGQYRFVNFALPGSIPINYLYHYNYAREKGYRPDVVFIEVSPQFFDMYYHSRNTYLYDVAPHFFILHHLFDFPLSYSLTWLRSRFIVGTAYPPGFFGNINKRILRETHLLHRTQLSFYVPHGRTYLTSDDRRIDQYPGLDNAQYRYGLTMAEFAGDQHIFTIDKIAVDSLFCLLDQLDNEKIPYLLWNPPVHPNLLQLQNERGTAQPYKELLRQLESRRPDLKFIDFNTKDNDLLHCPYFYNEGHLSYFCYTKVAAILTEISEKAPAVRLSKP